MLVVTGGAGMIGSNLVKALNDEGRSDILVVDHLKDGHKFANLSELSIADYLDRDEFLALMGDEEALRARLGGLPETIFHQGACSTTTEWDGQYMMANNYGYTVKLMSFAQRYGIPLIYASSAATYGDSKIFTEGRTHEHPLNVYGYSKLLTDEYLRRQLDRLRAPVVGLRYFNVYGPRESHKGSMASVAYHLHNQLLRGENPRLFKGCDGYPDGGQLRDFVYVGDVAAVNLWFYHRFQQDRGTDRALKLAGIYNCGTGHAEPFSDVARAVIDFYGRGSIEYIDFPESLKGHYQSFTEADLTALRGCGCDVRFRPVAEGVKAYLEWLTERGL